MSAKAINIQELRIDSFWRFIYSWTQPIAWKFLKLYLIICSLFHPSSICSTVKFPTPTPKWSWEKLEGFQRNLQDKHWTLLEKYKNNISWFRKRHTRISSIWSNTCGDWETTYFIQEGWKWFDDYQKVITIHLTGIVTPCYEKVVSSECMPLSKDSRKRRKLIIKFVVVFPSRLATQQKFNLRRILCG